MTPTASPSHPRHVGQAYTHIPQGISINLFMLVGRETGGLYSRSVRELLHGESFTSHELYTSVYKIPALFLTVIPIKLYIG